MGRIFKGFSPFNFGTLQVSLSLATEYSVLLMLILAARTVNIFACFFWIYILVSLQLIQMFNTHIKLFIIPFTMLTMFL